MTPQAIIKADIQPRDGCRVACSTLVVPLELLHANERERLSAPPLGATSSPNRAYCRERCMLGATRRPPDFLWARCAAKSTVEQRSSITASICLDALESDAFPDQLSRMEASSMSILWNRIAAARGARPPSGGTPPRALSLLLVYYRHHRRKLLSRKRASR